MVKLKAGKYGSYHFKYYLKMAENYETDIKLHLSIYKPTNIHVEILIELFETMKLLIDNVNMKALNQKSFNEKCDKLTHEMGILNNAQQYLYHIYELEVHPNS